MELIELKCGEIPYPVGMNIKSARDYIIEVAEILKPVLETTEKKIVVYCTGSSGAILASLLSVYINKNIFIDHIKKRGEKSHSQKIQTRYSIDNINIIIDDFSCTGSTITRIHEEVVADAIEFSRTEELTRESITYDYLILSNHNKNLMEMFEKMNIKYFLTSNIQL